jgi:hypothetical protein
MRIRDDITQTSEMVNKMEIWRKQIEDQIKANASKPAQLKSLKDLDKAIWDVENRLVSRSEVHSDDKYFPEAYKVYMNLIWLSGGVGQGASDEAGSIDYKPTDTQMQVLAEIEKELAATKAAFDKIESERHPGLQQGEHREAAPDRQHRVGLSAVERVDRRDLAIAAVGVPSPVPPPRPRPSPSPGPRPDVPSRRAPCV